MKLSTPALALFAVAASQASVSAEGREATFFMGAGNFQSCPTSGEIFQGLYFDKAPYGFGFQGVCAPYPGRNLTSTTAPSAVAAAAAAPSDPGLNGWSCFPPGPAECPAGFAISEMCTSYLGLILGETPMCADYCTTPGFFAVKCVPNPVTAVPLNGGSWLPTAAGPMCQDGSALSGVCISSNATDCQGANVRGKCSKYHHTLR
jgi:hypothetical protein